MYNHWSMVDVGVFLHDGKQQGVQLTHYLLAQLPELPAAAAALLPVLIDSGKNRSSCTPCTVPALQASPQTRCRQWKSCCWR